MSFEVIFYILFAYFCGAIPTGIIIGKVVKGIDVRDYGSHNSGANNVNRTLGFKYGVLTFIGDLLKGFLPVLIASRAGLTDLNLALIAMISILAHTYSIFINFRGGKGVATSFGVFLFLTPIIALFTLLIYLIIVFFTKYSGLGSIVSAALMPIFIYLFGDNKPINAHVLFLMTLAMSLFVLYRHKKNIYNLIHGKEKKVTEKVAK